MRCPNCETENPPDARFCLRCGTGLPASCPACGADLPEQAAFCPRCGHELEGASNRAGDGDGTAGGSPLGQLARQDRSPVSAGEDRLRRYIPEELLAKLQRAAQSGLDGERRTVTMLFCDVQGSTSAAERLDPEEWADIMNGAFEHLIAPIYRYEGTLARLMGDAILAFFGAPISHEDDPERAIRAGLEILSDIEPYRRRIGREWDIDLRLRVGINTGLVVVGAVGSDLRVEYTAMGDAVNVAARMEQTAQPGTVQVSEATKGLVEDLFEFEDLGMIEVKGRGEPVRSYRVVGARSRPASRRGIEGLHAPLIGRRADFEALEGAVDELTSAGAGRIVSVIGDAGLGKSRLIAELHQHLDAEAAWSDVLWSEGRSLSYETATPFAPVREIVRRLADLDENDVEAADYERMVALARRARPGRAEDLATFLGVLAGVPLPEAQEQRIGFFEPEALRTEVFQAVCELVEGLAAERPLVLVFEDLHWADSVTIELVSELLDLTERVALVLILAFRPRRHEPSWTVFELANRDHSHLHVPIELSPLDDDDTRALVGALLDIDGIPDTLRASILDRAEGNPLFVEELIRSMIDRGIVVRRDGHWVATSEVAGLVVPEALSAIITTRLDGLDEHTKPVAQAASVLGREFPYDELVAVLGEVEHLDESLIELQRREFLREISRMPKRRYRFRHTLLQETVYETVLLKTRKQLHAAAAEFLERLQPERVEDIADHLLRARHAERAIPYLIEAGERALAAYALPEALRRLETALELLGDPEETTLLRRALEGLGKAQELAFDFEAAAATYARLRDEGRRRDDASMLISGQNKWALVKGSVFDDRDEALAELADSEALARSSPDDPGLVEACVNRCFLHTAWAEFDEVEHYMREVSRLGTELGDTDALLFGMTHLANTLVFLTRFDEGLTQALSALEKAEELRNLRFQARLLTFAIPTCHMRNGDFADAVSAIERGMEIALRIGDRQSEMFAAVAQGKLAVSRGEFEPALSSFRRAVAAADATGLSRLRAVARCVTGSCYVQIGGPLLQEALDLHSETLELMRGGAGATFGTWLWSEMALCALEAEEVEMAASLADQALHTPTATVHLMRPQALFAACRVAVAQRRLDEALGLVEELEGYVEERRMRDHELTAALARGLVEAEAGRHDEALGHLERCVALAGALDLKRALLDVHALQARSLDALGRSDEAAAIRSGARGLVDEIAASVRDPGLSSAFRSGSTSLLAPADA